MENKFHALNLARKIVVEDGAAWAEVVEVNGRFRALVTVKPDGTLAGHLTAGRRTHRVKHWGTPPWVRWVGKFALASLTASLIFSGIAYIYPRDEGLLQVASVLWLATIGSIVFWIRGSRR